MYIGPLACDRSPPSWCRQHTCNQHSDWKNPSNGKGNANRVLLAVRLRVAYRLLQLERGNDVSIQHVKSHTGIRGNEAADKLANMGAEIEEGHRIVERG